MNDPLPGATDKGSVKVNMDDVFHYDYTTKLEVETMSLNRVTSPIRSRFILKRPVRAFVLLLITITVLSVAIHTTLKNEYETKLSDAQVRLIEVLHREAFLLHEVKDLRHEVEELIEEINILLETIDSMKPDIDPNADEVILLEKLVTAEAVGEGYEGMLAVANVVINRVASDSFPGTIAGVINQKNQFCPVRTGSIKSTTPTDEARQAVSDALKGYQVVEDALYFYNPSVVSRGHWIRSRETVGDIGNHRFAM